MSTLITVIGLVGGAWVVLNIASWAGAAAGFVQSLIAMSMGMSAYQGAFAVLTYTLPGAVIDLFRRFYPHRNNTYFSLSCAAANTVGALLTNLLVFRLEGVVFLLWLLIACVIGLFGGLLFQRIEKIPEFKRFIECQRD